MKYRYTRYTGDELEGIDLEELVSKLSDMLLSSGFDDTRARPIPTSGCRGRICTTRSSKRCCRGGLLSQETIEKLLGDPADADATSKIEQLIDDIVKRMQQQGYITGGPDFDAERERREGQGGDGPDGPPATFEVDRQDASTSSAIARSATCSARWARAAPAATTRAICRPASRPRRRRKPYEFGDTHEPGRQRDAPATPSQRTGLR